VLSIFPSSFFFATLFYLLRTFKEEKKNARLFSFPQAIATFLAPPPLAVNVALWGKCARGAAHRRSSVRNSRPTRMQPQRVADLVLLVLFLAVLRADFAAFSAYNSVESRSVNCDCHDPGDGAGDADPFSRVGPCFRSSMFMGLKNASRLRETRRELCRVSSTGVQRKNFVIVVTDALSERNSAELLRSLRRHGRAFAVQVPGAKWSHSIYSSFFTGQKNSNFLDLPLTATDNFFDAVFRSRFGRKDPVKTWWVGPVIPILRLYAPSAMFQDAYFGEFSNNTDEDEVHHGPGSGYAVEQGWNDFDICKQLEQELEKSVNLTEDRQKGWPRAHPRLMGGLGSDAERRKRLFGWLDAMKGREQNLVAYSSVLDAWQHDGDIQERCAWPRLTPRVNDDLKVFADWVDYNRDYVLVLMSDHGQNKRDDKEFILHGEGEDQNEGIFAVYSPALFPQGQPRLGEDPLPKLLISDVMASLVALIQDVDFPVSSIGVPRVATAAGDLLSLVNSTTLFPRTEPLSTSEVMILARVAMQLVQSAELRGVGSEQCKRASTTLSRLFDDQTEKRPIELFADAAQDEPWVAELQQAVLDLREVLLSTGASANLVAPVLAFVVVVSLGLLLVSLRTALAENRNRGIGARNLAAAGVIVGSSSGLVEYLFTWSDWKDYYATGSPFLLLLLGFTAAADRLFDLNGRILTDARMVRRARAHLAQAVVAVVAVKLAAMFPKWALLEAPVASLLTLWLLVMARQTYPSRNSGSVRPLIPFCAALIFGELVPITRRFDFLWIPGFIPGIGGIQLFAFLTLCAEFWGVVRAPTVAKRQLASVPTLPSHGISAATSQIADFSPVVTAILTHTWILFHGDAHARLILLGSLAALLYVRRSYPGASSDRAMQVILGAHALVLTLTVSGALATPDMNVQADFGSWGASANDKHIPLNAWSMFLSKFGVMLPLLVQLNLDQSYFFLRDTGHISMTTRAVLEAMATRVLPLQLLLHAAVSCLALRKIQSLMSVFFKGHRPDEAFALSLILSAMGTVQMVFLLFGRGGRRRSKLPLAEPGRRK
jgi:hypothetical protein